MVAVLPYLYTRKRRFDSLACRLHFPTTNGREPAKGMAFALLGAFTLGVAVTIGAREGVARFLGRRRTQRDSEDCTQANGSHPLPAPEPAWQPARVVSPPHTEWKPGAPQPCPLPGAGEFLLVDPSALPASEVYPLVISAAVPRPVAFISSVDESGAVNLSPYSFFNAMGFNPPTVAIGLCHSASRPEGKKDTLRNIEQTGEFVVNITSEWFVEAANHTCGDYPPGVDEMRLAGLTPLPSTKVKPPRVAESAVHMECVLRDIHRVHDSSGTVTTSIVIGQVVAFHVSPAVAGRSPSGRLTVDLARLAPVARCGGVTYARCTELYDMPRPDKDGKYPASSKPVAPKVSSSS
ncbi:hypothetical protein PLESTB_000529700 [Pleodorina starrii]|uniref:Flavin reductase like domain-containing protein n=1 Tax=Pleodorina starrii TaxID=330485 RepID=A0A9W6BGE8_9CHLO|nr:hypothetical protein PLESTM_000393100 [Pleodorina starrii]GLC51692.1 hypothetical protein PLESTB_000529700 [Pleodorina starrii]